MTKKTIFIIIAVILGIFVLYWAVIGFLSSLSSSRSVSTGLVGAPQSVSPYNLEVENFLGIPSEVPPSKTASPEVSLEQTEDSSRMVIKTGSLSLVVEDVSATAKKIIEYAKEKNGWVSNSSIKEDEQVPQGNVTIRVPAENFDEAMENFRGLAQKVKYETSQGTDITEEYVDLQSRLRNLEAAEEQLLEIMKRSGKISEILEVQRELTNVRAQIEQIKGRMQHLEKSVEMATITVYLALSEELLPIPPTEKWQPIYVLKKAWHSVLNALRGISYFLIWLIVYAVIWVPIVAIVWLAVRFIKKRSESV